MPEGVRSPLDRATPDLLASATVAAAGSLSLPLAEVEALRANPGAAQPQVAKSLRNADEQTVAGVVAMLRAIDAHDWQSQSFRDWAVIGCPRFLGRMIITGVINRFYEDPKYSINPHIIPNFSLHSTSGTVSVGFTMQGPNFGVGGGPGNLSEGLLTGLSIITEGRHPGLWLVLSEFDPEPQPDKAGKSTNAVHVHAVALAIIAEASLPRQRGEDGIGRLRLRRQSASSSAAPMVRDLVRFIASTDDSPFHCPVEGLGVIEFERARTR